MPEQKPYRKKIIPLLLLTLFCGYIYCGAAYAGGDAITVDFDKETGHVNKYVFGSNFKGRDIAHLRTLPGYSVSDHGSGVWDGLWREPVKNVMELARNAGVSIVRYANSFYKLNNIIGPDREHNRYGLDEFLRTTESIGAEPVIIIPIHPGVVGGLDDDYRKRAKHAADIVEYLNTPLGENPDNDDDPDNENIAWAEIRAANGHSEPYNVKYFEIGNEPYARPNVKGKPQKGGSGVDFYWGYGLLFNKFSGAMKAVDPSIKTGLSLIAILPDRRNKKILSIVGNKLDYVILHMYFNQEVGMSEGMNSDDALLMNLSRPVLSTDITLKKFRELIEEITGKANVPFGISEYNCWHVDSCHKQLSSALLNAELVKIFMKPENNVLMANHWQMSNGLYGMIRAYRYFKNDPKAPVAFKKRPNYYVYEMYNRHFGDILIDAEVNGDTYDIRGYEDYVSGLLKLETPALDTKIPYLSVNASRSADKKKLYLMVINKNPNEAVTSSVTLKNILPAKKADAWILTGPSVHASNEKKTDNVNVKHKEFEINGNSFEYTFERHSLTAIEIDAKQPSLKNPAFQTLTN